jgi:hypothetical protein
MAVVQFSSIRDGAIVVTWPTLGGTDTGAPFRLPTACDLTFQVSGTFGGATVTFQGSNDSTTWHGLSQKGIGTTTMSYAVNTVHSANEVPLFVRPFVTGGTSSSITVILAAFPTYAKTGY